MFRQFLDISRYFTLLKKYLLFLHQTWQMNRRPIANYIYVKNVSECQICDVTVMTSCFLPLLKFLICIFLQCVRKSTSRGVEAWKNFVHITKIKWNIAFLNMKNNSAKYGVPPTWEKSPNWSRNFVPANAAMLRVWCARWLKQKWRRKSEKISL